MKSDNSDVITTWKKHTKKCQQNANNMQRWHIPKSKEIYEFVIDQCMIIME